MKESWKSISRWSAGSVVVAITLMAAGCAHEPQNEFYAPGMGGEFMTRPPVFISGPASVFLTNSTGFSAHLEMTYAPPSERKPLSGQLVARGSQLFFDPVAKPGKVSGASKYGFIWDVATGKGYILSEALQGYAPISSTTRFTNLVVQTPQPVTERLDGHPAERTTIAVTGSDGSESKLDVSQAADLGGLALRMTLLDGPMPPTVKLSQIRKETVSEKLFLPPDGFTAYPTAEAMVDEVVLRENGGRKGFGPRDPNGQLRTRERMDRPGY